MFEKLNLTKYNLFDNGEFAGIVLCNTEKIKNNSFADLITRNNNQLLLNSLGSPDYQGLDAFIVRSLTDYYNKINIGNKELVTKKNNEYNRLYQMYNGIIYAKKNKLPNVDNLYDEIIYELYTVGYKY